MTPPRAFLCAFAGGFLALVAGHALLSGLTAPPVEPPSRGPLHIPDA